MVHAEQCLVCESTDNLQMIFDKENQEILRMLQSIATAPLMMNDYLPRFICLQCSNDLKTTYNFKMLYAMTSAKMKDMLLFPKRLADEFQSNICEYNLKEEETIDRKLIKCESDQNESGFEVLIIHSDEKDDKTETLVDVKFDDIDGCDNKTSLENETCSKYDQEDNLKEKTSEKTIEKLTKAMTVSDTQDNTYKKIGDVCKTGKHISSESEQEREECKVLFSNSADSLSIQENNSGNCHEKPVGSVKSINPSLKKKFSNKVLRSISNSYKCTECDIYGLQEHEALHWYICNECWKSYTTPKSLSEHKFSHSGLNNCSKCNKSFGTLRGFKEHMARHEHPGLFKCNVCGSLVENLKAHKNLHKNFNFYKCNICSIYFLTLYAFYAHSFTHAELNKCYECGESFSSLSKFKKHVDLHKNPDIVFQIQCALLIEP